MMDIRNLPFLVSVCLYLCAHVTIARTQECIGTFGMDCEYKCHCKNNVTCNQTTGYCPNKECQDGWLGDYCHLGNSARHQVARQSSNYRSDCCLAPMAVDGETNQLDFRKCTHTKGEGEDQPWWRVDLINTTALFKLTLYNRGVDGCNDTEECRKRLKDFKVWMTNNISDLDPDGQYGQPCTHYQSIVELGGRPELICTKPAVGRFLYIRLMSNQTILTLCEVVILAYQYRECPQGRYGVNCNYECQCVNSDGCDPITGECPSGCNQWYTGRFCNIEIPTFMTADVTQTTINIQWSPARVSYNIPDKAEVIAYRLQHKPSSGTWKWTDIDQAASELKSGIGYNISVTGLFAYREYTFRMMVLYEVNTTNTRGQGIGPERVYRTACGAPITGPSISNMTSSSPNRTTIKIKPIPQNELTCEYVTSYVIYYALASTNSTVLNVTETANTTAIVIGLPAGANVSFTVAVVNNGGYATNGTLEYYIIPQASPASQGEIAAVLDTAVVIALGCSATLVVILAVTVALVIILRGRKQHSNNSHQASTETTNVPDAIPMVMQESVFNNIDITSSVANSVPTEEPEVIHEEIYENAAFVMAEEYDYEMSVKDLLNTVKAKKKNDFSILEEEFKTFPNKLTKPHTAAYFPENKNRNRFKNIIPYDHNRVILSLEEGVANSDYINASYIDGYDKKKKFIAAQGPIPTTISDFWRLVWQEKCPAIAMVTSFAEANKLKCAEYFPMKINKGETFGDFKVTLTAIKQLPHFTIRTLQLNKGEEQMVIKHHHFTTWPDHGTPKFASSMVEYWRSVTADGQGHEGPTLVHCSAGVGRTGTFLAIDYLFRQGEAEGKVNPHECILGLRNCRTNMVQVVDQYAFIHDALVEYFCVGKTSILCSDFIKEYQKSTTPDQPGMKSKLGTQHELLSMFDTVHSEDDYADARSPENATKNRCDNILPDRFSVARLSLPIEGRNSYINAVFVDGFSRNNAFVVTQFPLADTVVDFWRMVFDYNISAIVTIGVLPAQEFWPSEETPFDFGVLSIECSRIDSSYPEYTTREFKLSRKSKVNKEPATTRDVRQYHFQAWTGTAKIPADPSSLVNLISTVLMRQQKTSAPLLVNCLDGACRSGVFCATYCAIEKVKLEQEVDIFEQSRLVRMHRPQFLDSFEQYSFVYDAVAAYLQGFETYANFN